MDDRRRLLGARIRELRAERRLSQERLAEMMGANVTYVSSVERGKENPTLDYLIKVADALEVDLVDLFVFAWLKLSEKELRRKLRAMIDQADLDGLRELLTLMKARNL
jgi:transcriptional regulator with XRE-family HTH domain